MKTEINPAHRSKIIWTALATQLIALLAIFDVIPPEAEEPLTEIVMLVATYAIVVFRKWFTKP